MMSLCLGTTELEESKNMEKRMTFIRVEFPSDEESKKGYDNNEAALTKVVTSVKRQGGTTMRSNKRRKVDDVLNSFM
jgi:hypothetical protein